MSDALQRCPRCGNENPADSYQCSFCGKRLRFERIENIGIFKRIESEAWTNPLPWYLKIAYLFIRPNYAFWDINHKRKDAPGFLILLFNSLLWGLMGLAFFSHFQITSISGQAISPLSVWLISYQLSVFIAFFIFGFVFQFVYFAILIWLFSKAANYAVGFSERLESRFGEDEKFERKEMSPFSIYKGGTILQKQQSHKFKMMLCAFAPFLLINGIKILIILIAFPSTTMDASLESFNLDIYNNLFNSPVWAVLDLLDALTIAIWIPILISIAIRELGNSSTYRVLISSIIVGVLVAIFFYFMRPTLFGAFI
ncbi:MAG: zinc ribbon domain-containing protein [Promethearchaeota archaeon]|nr:MAG: zinc ribbon domain-containing protein [Candidatus Lokiarchaeota archaeon]